MTGMGAALATGQSNPTAQTSGASARLADLENVWAIVLAGGEGSRLRPFVREKFGQDRPKQYVRLLGPRTLLRQTLDRVGLGIGPARTIVVTTRQHAGYIAEEMAESTPHIIAQPCDRGTAAGVLYPAHWIAWRNPEAVVAIFPSDHFVEDEAAFMAHVAELVRWVERHPDRLVLLGARPTSAEVEYGWVEPGDLLGGVPAGPIHAVRRFWEKPTRARAEACLASGCLWNTSILVGKVAHLLQAGWQGLPDMSDRLARLEPFAGTEEEEAATRQAFELMPKANFSRAILEASPEALAVSGVASFSWSDLGSPRRVLEVLAGMEMPPRWAEHRPVSDR